MCFVNSSSAKARPEKLIRLVDTYDYIFRYHHLHPWIWLLNQTLYTAKLLIPRKLSGLLYSEKSEANIDGCIVLWCFINCRVNTGWRVIKITIWYSLVNMIAKCGVQKIWKWWHHHGSVLRSRDVTIPSWNIPFSAIMVKWAIKVCFLRVCLFERTNLSGKQNGVCLTVIDFFYDEGL